MSKSDAKVKRSEQKLPRGRKLGLSENLKKKEENRGFCHWFSRGCDFEIVGAMTSHHGRDTYQCGRNAALL